jgi:hypothetical protein
LEARDEEIDDCNKEQLEKALEYHEKKRSETVLRHSNINLHYHHTTMIETIRTRIQFLD